jgi:hypothetical protein
MDEVRSIRIAEIHQCFFYGECCCKGSNSGTIRSDPLEKKGTSISTFSEMCRKNIQLCTNEAGMPHARFYVTLKKDDESVGVDNCSTLRGGNDKGRRQFYKGTYSE